MEKVVVIINDKYAEYDMMGIIKIIGKKKDIDKMSTPVKCCHCGKPYDLQKTKVVHRFADCTLFTTPCCNIKADDRTWKSIPDYVMIDKNSLVKAY